MEFVSTISFILGIIFAIAYAYQILYFLIGIGVEIRSRFISSNGDTEKTNRRRSHDVSQASHRYAFLLAARNEENVIGHLIDSIKGQSYPSHLVDIYVVADNCTDDTAAVAKEAGAICYERFDKEKVGKGFALTWLLHKIKEKEGAYNAYDAYVIFDADNILDKDYLKYMDIEFSNGFNVVTGYRNSKNFGTNWITAGYSVAFMREAQYVNRPRRILHSSATVSGTGYLFSSALLEKHDGWPYHLLTEDIEMSADYIVNGEKIGYAENAMFYDEQPTRFWQSWAQRIRWTHGFYQVVFRYGKGLLGNLFKDKSMFLSRYDMFMFLAPSMIFNAVSVILAVIAVVLNIVNMQEAKEMSPYVGQAFISFGTGYYLLNFVQGAITILSEWNEIHDTTTARKIGSMFTYPIYMFSYIPISLVALFTKPKWKPIKHTVTKSSKDFKRVTSSKKESVSDRIEDTAKKQTQIEDI